MKVLVTGATGFVGFHTVMALSKAGHSVRLCIRNLDKMQKLYANTDVDISDYTLGEMTDEAVIEKALEGCDAVIHTAAIVSNDPEDAEYMQKTNLKGTELVIGGAVKKGIESILYVSSVAALFDPELDTVNEDTPLANPMTAYGESKKQCDEYVRGLIDDGANIVITYPAAIIGPDDPMLSESNQSLMFLYKLAFMNMPSGMQIIDVRELADIQVKLVEGDYSGKYIVAGHYIPWKDYGILLDKVTQKKNLKVPMPGWLLIALGILMDFFRLFIKIDLPLSKDAAIFGTRWVEVDDSKLLETLGISYRPLEDTLRDTLKWMAKEQHIHPKWGEHL